MPHTTMQWTGTNADQLRAFTGGQFEAIPPSERAEPDLTAQVYNTRQATWIAVRTGQHITRGQHGEYYPLDETAPTSS